MDLRKYSFLVIDDNAFMRKLLRSMLSTFNATDIIDASDGIEAFKLMKDGLSPDMIITDAKMPIMGGLEFTRWVRTDEKVNNNSIPIILVTAFADSEVVVAARDAGVNEFLAKPVSAEDLIRHIEAAFKSPRTYVRCEKYSGPDRRRRQIKLSVQDRRQRRKERVGQRLQSPALNPPHHR